MGPTHTHTYTHRQRKSARMHESERAREECHCCQFLLKSTDGKGMWVIEIL